MTYRKPRLSKRNLFYSRPQNTRPTNEKPKRRFKPFKWVWRNYLRLCTVLGFMLILSAVVSTIIMEQFAPSTPLKLPPKMVLQMTLKDHIPEKPQKDPVLAALGISKASLYESINAIKRAKDDDQISAFVMEYRAGAYGPAQLAELRAAIEDFKTSGKPTIIYAPSYENLNAGLAAYYIASVFDEIWMQPVGMLSLTGLYSEQPFLKDALQKFGIKADVFKRKEYKAAMENIDSAEMSPANREMIEALLGDIHDHLTAEIAQSRDILVNIFESYINQGVLTDQEAVNAKLIDRLGYGDELVIELNEKLGGTEEDRIPYIGLDQYITFTTHGAFSTLQIIRQLAENQFQTAPKSQGEIALIFGQGPISQYAPDNRGFDLGSGNIIAADRMAEWIYDAVFDDTIKTIVLRIDSPGGSPQASETIRRALIKAKSEGKRVVVSMGTMSASGGYWIASAADHIFAHDLTITGSIGVVGAKFDLTGLWKNLLVNWDYISTANNADLFSVNTPLDEDGRMRYEEMMDNIYEAFVERVAEGRSLNFSSVDDVAKGRVWSGLRAQDNKLVDTLGGLDDALLWAAKDLGYESAEEAGVVIIPSSQAGLEAIFQLLGVSVSQWVRGISTLNGFISDLDQDQVIRAYAENPLK